MNHQQTIEELAYRSGEQVETCEAVMKAYELYAENHLKKARRNNLEEAAQAVAEETGLAARICENILTQFFDLLAERIPFMKRQGGK
ncbi:hypothetical protein [Enterococcus pallens]|uniref:Uncharacterized protein n=1 Tax=Enterococcus pallens ATCC BAA-351 TaxID=1158607 RepID=R2SHG3_9ENTE|nr:hypothetical protein [Enterococcus pallens]EOH94720.1 hypothetical protein UAU_01642 [Enterococcus pallens ATCC BAA-351]EOU14961.1 hypothetical protein I588_04611 [Enterococcus pallens ATCC BAA-351]OJG78220.1 hypothetical protein RV10_GL001708 [Enterococcus pallens]